MWVGRHFGKKLPTFLKKQLWRERWVDVGKNRRTPTRAHFSGGRNGLASVFFCRASSEEVRGKHFGIFQECWSCNVIPRESKPSVVCNCKKTFKIFARENLLGTLSNALKRFRGLPWLPLYANTFTFHLFCYDIYHCVFGPLWTENQQKTPLRVRPFEKLGCTAEGNIGDHSISQTTKIKRFRTGEWGKRSKTSAVEKIQKVSSTSSSADALGCGQQWPPRGTCSSGSSVFHVIWLAFKIYPHPGTLAYSPWSLFLFNLQREIFLYFLTSLRSWRVLTHSHPRNSYCFSTHVLMKNTKAYSPENYSAVFPICHHGFTQILGSSRRAISGGTCFEKKDSVTNQSV